MTLEISTERIRNLISQIKKTQSTTKEAEAFMLLFGEKLREEIDTTISRFISQKVS